MYECACLPAFRSIALQSVQMRAQMCTQHPKSLSRVKHKCAFGTLSRYEEQKMRFSVSGRLIPRYIWWQLPLPEDTYLDTRDSLFLAVSYLRNLHLPAPLRHSLGSPTTRPTRVCLLPFVTRARHQPVVERRRFTVDRCDCDGRRSSIIVGEVWLVRGAYYTFRPEMGLGRGLRGGSSDRCNRTDFIRKD